MKKDVTMEIFTGMIHVEIEKEEKRAVIMAAKMQDAQKYAKLKIR